MYLLVLIATGLFWVPGVRICPVLIQPLYIRRASYLIFDVARACRNTSTGHMRGCLQTLARKRAYESLIQGQVVQEEALAFGIIAKDTRLFIFCGFCCFRNTKFFFPRLVTPLQ